MKFRLFTDANSGKKVAVNVDYVRFIDETAMGTTAIVIRRSEEYETGSIEVSEPFDVVFSRLNTIAE